MVVTAVSNDELLGQGRSRRQRGGARPHLRQAQPGGRGVSPEDRRPAPQTLGRGRRGVRRGGGGVVVVLGSDDQLAHWLAGLQQGSRASPRAGIGGEASRGDQLPQRREDERREATGGAAAARGFRRVGRQETVQRQKTDRSAAAAEIETTGGGTRRAERIEPDRHRRHQRDELPQPFENQETEHEALELPERQSGGQVAGGEGGAAIANVHAGEGYASAKHDLHSSHVEGSALLEAAQSKKNQLRVDSHERGVTSRNDRERSDGLFVGSSDLEDMRSTAFNAGRSRRTPPARSNVANGGIVSRRGDRATRRRYGSSLRLHAERN